MFDYLNGQWFELINFEEQKTPTETWHHLVMTIEKEDDTGFFNFNKGYYINIYWDGKLVKGDVKATPLEFISYIGNSKKGKAF